MRNTKPSWRNMPGETNPDKMREFDRRYPPDPKELAAFEASSKRLMDGIVENINKDLQDNEPATPESSEQPNK